MKKAERPNNFNFLQKTMLTALINSQQTSFIKIFIPTRDMGFHPIHFFRGGEKAWELFSQFYKTVHFSDINIFASVYRYCSLQLQEPIQKIYVCSSRYVRSSRNSIHISRYTRTAQEWRSCTLLAWRPHLSGPLWLLFKGDSFRLNSEGPDPRSVVE